MTTDFFSPSFSKTRADPLLTIFDDDHSVFLSWLTLGRRLDRKIETTPVKAVKNRNVFNGFLFLLLIVSEYWNECQAFELKKIKKNFTFQFQLFDNKFFFWTNLLRKLLLKSLRIARCDNLAVHLYSGWYLISNHLFRGYHWFFL